MPDAHTHTPPHTYTQHKHTHTHTHTHMHTHTHHGHDSPWKEEAGIQGIHSVIDVHLTLLLQKDHSKNQIVVLANNLVTVVV